MNRKTYLLHMVSLVCMYACSGQETQPDIRRQRTPAVKVLPVPAFGYTPETGAYAGAVCLFTLDLYHDSLTRHSNVKLELNYTWRKQVILENTWNYFFRRERWYTQGLLRYSEYPDLYFGIGETTPAGFLRHYQSRRLVADVNLMRKVGKHFFIGPQARYLDYRAVGHDEGYPLFPELKDATAWGLGYIVLKDTRDNLLNAARGVYLELTNTYNRAAAASYVKVYADMRGYITPFAGTVAALRWYHECTFGTPPFFDYALMGGDEIARGYFYGRYREKNLSTLQAEVRQHVTWRIGLALFGGMTKLYPDVRRLSLLHIKPNYGGGIRFLIDRR